MADDTSPGQTCYAAYWPALGNGPPLGRLPPVPWDHLSPGVQRAWEAAAQAVLEAAPPGPGRSQGEPRTLAPTPRGQAGAS